MIIDKTKPILITGGAGFIGYHLTRKLLVQDYQIIAYDNLNNYYDTNLKIARLAELQNFPKFKFVKGDVADFTLIKDLFEQNQFDIIINLAAQAGVRYSIENPRSYIESNIIGFFNILECCRYYPVKHLVYASSSSVYGANKKTPFSVDDRVDNPVSLYAATKKSNELMAYTYSHLYQIPATGLRFFTVYGPYGRPDMAYFLFTKKILNNEPIEIFNNGNMYRDFTYIDDVVDALVNIIPKTPCPDENSVKHKVYNIGNNRPVKLMDFIETLEECLGKKAVKKFLPMQKGDVYITYADVDELINDFNFKPNTSIKIGLRKFVDWYKEYYS